MTAPRPTVRHALTDAQTWLLERHRRGLLRLAGTLAAKNSMAPTDIMFVVADRQGRIGNALSAAVPAHGIGPVVLPGRAAELEGWVERLAVHGPLWDLQDSSTGIPVVVIDEHDDGCGARGRAVVVTNRELLLASLEAAVPLWAAELSGTPLRTLLAEGPALARIVAKSGDALQFEGCREGRAAEAFNALARAVAILSFLPGGVRFCGVSLKNVHPDEGDVRCK